MKIKLFENFDIDLDVTYELYIIDRNGDESLFDPETEDFLNVNPNDLQAVFSYYQEYKDDFKLIIKKVTRENLDENTIKALLQSKKYNI